MKAHVRYEELESGIIVPSAPSYKELGSGVSVPYHFTRRPERPKAFDFFCGAGGMGCGLIRSGFEIVGANEFDPHASLTYMINLGAYPMQIHYLDEGGKETLDRVLARSWGLKKKADYDGTLTEKAIKKAFGDADHPIEHHMAGSGWIAGSGHPPVRNFWFGDIHKLTGKEILDALGMEVGELDLVAGGPPCQGFSRAGKQEVGDPRNALIYEYARLIVELQPKTFIMEEVPDIVDFMDPDGVPVLDKFCFILQEGGYGNWDTIRKSLATQVGAAAAIRPGKAPSKPGRPRQSRKEDEAAQARNNDQEPEGAPAEDEIPEQLSFM